MSLIQHLVFGVRQVDSQSPKVKVLTIGKDGKYLCSLPSGCRIWLQLFSHCVVVSFLVHHPRAFLWSTSSNASLLSSYSVTFFVYIIACPLAGVVSSRFKEVKHINVAGFAFLLIFAICMSTTKLDGEAAVWGYPVLLGLGLALILCAIFSTAQLSAPPELMSVWLDRNKVGTLLTVP